MKNYQPIIDVFNAEFNYSKDEAQRIFHGRGGCFEGLKHINIDYYPPYFHWRLYEPDEHIIGCIDALETLGIDRNLHIVQQRFNKVTDVMDINQSLLPPKKHKVKELDVEYLIDFENQNPGLFLDMRAGKEWLAKHSENKKILNLFCYTGGFSLVACKHKAAMVVNADMNGGVLNTAKQNHRINGFEQPNKFLKHNILKSFGKFDRMAPFDVIVVDPPSFQAGSFNAKTQYKNLVTRTVNMLADDGFILFCLNDPLVSVNDFLSQTQNDQVEFVKRIENISVLKEVEPEFGLKCLLFKKKAETAN